MKGMKEERVMSARRTTIVCTIGPASEHEETLLALARAGMEVARLNFSHGTQEQKAVLIERLRRVEQRLGRPIAIMADLQGPKLRVGEFEGGKAVKLEEGGRVVLTVTPCFGNARRVPVNYRRLPREVRAGDQVLLADGTITLRVEKVEGNDVECTVLHGGMLSSRKGLNLPGVALSVAALTSKDKKDVAFAVRAGVDWIALSFVRAARDVEQLRREIQKVIGKGDEYKPRIIAKIEKPEAVKALGAIVAAADAVMVARGDLGVELQPWRVPVIQKEIIRQANAAGKPVITATQMLESMISSPVATRAETSDVANAVLDGTDAVMLSGESAAGAYPVEAVQTMDAIVRAAEASALYTPRAREGADGSLSTTDAMCAAAVCAARKLGAAGIAVFTHSGRTAMHLAHYRPLMPMLALCSDARYARQLMLYWNMRTALVPVCTSRHEQLRAAEAAMMAAGIVKRGDVYVVVSGSSLQSGGTNWLEVRTGGVTPDERK